MQSETERREGRDLAGLVVPSPRRESGGGGSVRREASSPVVVDCGPGVNTPPVAPVKKKKPNLPPLMTNLPPAGSSSSTKNMPPGATTGKQEGKTGFSLSKWQAMIASRCDKSKAAVKSEPGPQQLTEFGEEFARGTTELKGPSFSSEPKDSTEPLPFFPGGLANGMFTPRLAERCKSDLEYLGQIFKTRDAGRMQETVLPIARLLWAKDADGAKQLLTLARDSLIGLSEEGWFHLQLRYPGVEPVMPKPDVLRMCSQPLGASMGSPPRRRHKLMVSDGSPSAKSDADANSQGSNSTRGSMGRSTFGTPVNTSGTSTPTGARITGFSIASTGSGRSPRKIGRPSNVSQTINEEEPSRMSGMSGVSVASSVDSRLVTVASVDDDDPRESLATTTSGRDRLAKVVNIDDDESWFPSVPELSVSTPSVSMFGYNCECPCMGPRGKGSGRSSGNRDVRSVTEDCGRCLEWDLQFTLTGALDEVFQSLLHDTSDDAVGNATVLMEKARDDVLEWTVKRWNTLTR